MGSARMGKIVCEDPTRTADVRTRIQAQTWVMSIETTTALKTLSRELEDLVTRVASGIVAVKAAPYRTVSGVCIGQDLVAVADHILKRVDRVPVVSSDGKEATAVILGRASSLDLAILKVEGASFTPLPHADAAGLKAGS